MRGFTLTISIGFFIACQAFAQNPIRFRIEIGPIRNKLPHAPIYSIAAEASILRWNLNNS